MSYTTGFMTDAAHCDELDATRPRFRPLALGATVIGFGAMAAALVIASMAATSAMLDALSADPETHAAAPLARPQAVAAKSQATPAAPIVASVRPEAPAIADAKPPAEAKPAAQNVAPISIAAAPSVVPPPTAAANGTPSTDSTPNLLAGSVPLPPSRGTVLASLEASGAVPLPPSRSAILPSTTIPGAPSVTATPRSAPPPVIAAPDIAQPPAAAPATESSVVPLPPRRPGSFEIASLPPQTEPAPPASVRTSPPTVRAPESEAKPQAGEAKPQADETKLQKSVATAPNAAPQDNRNFFQRLFGLSSQPSATTPSSVAGYGARAAIYDISTHTVYMPNGERLEAHSGLGASFDDPRTIREKNRGVTPPNVYQLSLREQLFHGVPALRMNPVGDSSMYGRDGMLAHTYMLGARGDSNGCVSFRDYQRFLAAYRSGQVTHLVVVAHSGDAPSMSVASARPDRDTR